MHYDLNFAGNPFNPQLRDYLMSITVSDSIGLLSDSVDIQFVYDKRLPDFEIGMIVSVKLGDAGRLWDVGHYNISEINLQGPPHELTVKGMSSPFVLVKALQNSHRRNWQRHEATLSEIIEEVVKDTGLKLEFNARDELMAYTAQVGETDAAFLMRLSRLRDLRFKVSGDRIVVFKTDVSTSAAGVSLKTVKVRYSGDTIRYTYERNEREAYKSATAWVQNIKEAARLKVGVGSGSPMYEFKETFSTVEEARRACQAKVSESNRYTRVATIDMPGQPDIIAGGTIVLSEFPREMIDRKFLIETVNHNFSSTGGYTISASLVHTDV